MAHVFVLMLLFSICKIISIKGYYYNNTVKDSIVCNNISDNLFIKLERMTIFHREVIIIMTNLNNAYYHIFTVYAYPCGVRVV